MHFCVPSERVLKEREVGHLRWLWSVRGACLKESHRLPLPVPVQENDHEDAEHCLWGEA